MDKTNLGFELTPRLNPETVLNNQTGPILLGLKKVMLEGSYSAEQLFAEIFSSDENNTFENLYRIQDQVIADQLIEDISRAMKMTMSERDNKRALIRDILKRLSDEINAEMDRDYQ